MKSNIKIAIYTGRVPSTTFIERLIEGLAENGNSIYCFGRKHKNSKPKKNIKYVTYKNRFGKLISLLKYSFLLSLLKRKEKQLLDSIIHSKKQNSTYLKLKFYPVLYHKPHIFHLQWAKGIDDWMWVQKFGIKLVVSLRGAHINYSPITDDSLAKLYTENFPKVDGFHAVCKAIGNEANCYGTDFKKMHVVYSGLDLKELNFELKNFNSTAPLHILSIGRDHWKKGYSYALKSLYELKNRGISFTYTIIGIKTSEELLYLRKQFGLETEVNFVDSLPFESIKNQIQQAQVLLLPSVEEGIANVVLEAMATGTLVLSTNCGGMQEIIDDTQNGFLVPQRNSEAMANCLEKVTKLSLNEYRYVTLNARKSVENKHGKTKMINDMENLYANVLTAEV